MIQPFANRAYAFVVRANLNANRALPHTWQHHVQIQNCCQQTVRNRVAFEVAFGRDAEIVGDKIFMRAASFRNKTSQRDEGKRPIAEAAALGEEWAVKLK